MPLARGVERLRVRAALANGEMARPAPAVAEGTRSTFDRLRSLHAYGVMFYDAFTIVDDQAHLVIEQAFRERFVEFYGGIVPFEDASGTVHEAPAPKFDVLYDEIHKDGRLRRPHRWRLRLRRTSTLIYFDGMLDSLLRWARGEGLLLGQRNRTHEPLLKWFRNYAAHGRPITSAPRSKRRAPSATSPRSSTICGAHPPRRPAVTRTGPA